MKTQHLSLKPLLALCATLFLAIAMVACGQSHKGAEEAIKEHYKNQGAQEIQTDFYYTDPAQPEKAYISVTVTYNFATSDGKPQKEYAGYIVARNGDTWKVDQNTKYTTEVENAKNLLAGGK